MIKKVKAGSDKIGVAYHPLPEQPANPSADKQSVKFFQSDE